MKSAFSLREMMLWAGDDPGRRLMLAARTAGGPGDDPTETMIRLMVWAAARLRPSSEHSGLIHPLDILREGSAWCDQCCAVVGFFALHLYGLMSRRVELRHSDGVSGHTVLEVWYDDGWHLFDCAQEHQGVYRDVERKVLSNAELRAHPEVVAAAGNWWYSEITGCGKEGFYGPGSTFVDDLIARPGCANCQLGTGW